MKKSCKLKNKKQIGLVFVALVLVGIGGWMCCVKLWCSREAQVAQKNAYMGISKNDIQEVRSEVDVNWDLNDPLYFYKNSEVVAIMKIESIEAVRNLDPVTKEPVYPQTLGKMNIEKVYKGELRDGEQVAYARPGATLSFEEYLKGLSKPEVEKIKHLNKGKTPKGHVKVQFANDIEIEVGKKYLAFMNAKTNKNGEKEYLISWMQYGLRKVKGEGENILVLNNEAKAWEKIDKSIKE